jgi:hypothetical protein
LIYVDESTVKVGGVILPGLFKSIDIKGEAQIEEQQVEGNTSKPKQASGFEDAKVTLELVLEDGPTKTKLQKLATIQNLFKKPGQSKPVVHQIVNEHTAARGISKVIFKSLQTKEENKNSQLSVTIEFWEYITMTITATKTAAANASLNQDYQQYLSTSRGSAPKTTNKTSQTAAQDNAQGQAYKNKLAAMPY